MSWPRCSLPTTATVSCVYAAGMLLSIGSLYLVPSAFDYRGPASEAYEAGDFAAAAEYYGRIVELRPRDSRLTSFEANPWGSGATFTAPSPPSMRPWRSPRGLRLP